MTAVFLHIYYPHLYEEIVKKLKEAPFEFNLYVNLVSGHSEHIDVLKDFPTAVVHISPNQGMDIGGQLRTLNFWLSDGKDEEFIVFIHSKGKPVDYPDANKVRETDELRNLLMSIITPLRYPQVTRAFADSSVGMIGVEEWYRYPGLDHGDPIDGCDYYCDLLKLNNYQTNSFGFCAGTMFWVRSSIYRKAFEGVDILGLVGELPPSSNGGRIHALERILGYIVLSNNYKIQGI